MPDTARFADEDLSALMRLLRWRRDVRHFRPDPVPEAALSRLREAMALAPSVGNARPWRVVQVDDPALRRAVREVFRDCNSAAESLYPAARRAAYRQLKLEGMERAPVQLAVFCIADPDSGHGLGRRTMPETLQQSVAMAIFSIWLAARAQNLGMGMVSILDPERVETLLGMPADWHFSAWLCIGYPEFRDDTPLLHRTGWQENAESDWLRLAPPEKPARP